MIYRRVVLVITVVLWLVGCTGAGQTTPDASYLEDLNGAVFDPPRAISNFGFASTLGEEFKLSDHNGEIILLYFGYRTCPDFCPTTFTELRQIYLALGEPAERVKVVFITVDPERDDLDSLTLYTQAFHDDFIGLRAEGESLQNVMDEFGVIAEKRQLADSALSYLIDHTASLFLIGPDGRLQVQYLYGTAYQDILEDVQRILDSTASSNSS